jgi:hypothetical protein
MGEGFRDPSRGHGSWENKEAEALEKAGAMATAQL